MSTIFAHIADTFHISWEKKSTKIAEAELEKGRRKEEKCITVPCHRIQVPSVEKQATIIFVQFIDKLCGSHTFDFKRPF